MLGAAGAETLWLDLCLLKNFWKVDLQVDREAEKQVEMSRGQGGVPKKKKHAHQNSFCVFYFYFKFLDLNLAQTFFVVFLVEWEMGQEPNYVLDCLYICEISSD